MNANDLEVHGVDTLSSGATVLHPHVGDVPVGHLLIDVDLTDAVAGAADAAGVVATLHGDLVIATGRTYAPGRWQLEVPAVLLSGHHGQVGRWRREQALQLTARRRPDLIDRARAAGVLSAEDERYLRTLGL